MDELKPFAVFAETVAAGSMSAAGRRLGMSPSAVSQTIRALERQVGVTLLHRSTRKLTLTEAGERCYPHCCRLLEAAQAATNSLELARDAPTGELRVAAPVGFAAHITPALQPLLAQSPKLRLHLLFDDSMIDLIDARIDIAIRVGPLADSSWIARRLCEFEMILCASPAYLDRHGLPESPQDLANHHWLASTREEIDLQQSAENLPILALDLHNRNSEHQRLQVGVHIVSNNHLALQAMCEQGLGIARLSYADVQPLLAQGALVRLLPHWYFAPVTVSAVTHGREGEPAKVRLAVAALKRHFSALPGLAPKI